MASINKQVRVFTDFDLSFTKHPVTGDIAVLKNENAIKRAVRNLILTNHYERPFHSEIGCNIRGMLFNPASPMLNNTIKRIITQTINEFEPRVRIVDIEITNEIDNNSLNISIHFVIVNTTKRLTVDIVLERTR